MSFVQKWGLLGLDPIQDDAVKPYYGDDPLDFIWSHAYTIQNVLRLHDAL